MERLRTTEYRGKVSAKELKIEEVMLPMGSSTPKSPVTSCVRRALGKFGAIG